MLLEKPVYTGDLDEYAKEVCKYADKIREGQKDIMSITLEFNVTIFGAAGKEPKIASVGPTVRYHDNKLTRLAQMVSEIFSQYL